MANDLERRRLAIADALRTIMAEPLPSREPGPAVQIRTVATVPPVESVGSMSRTASMALFGHA
jgi:hypothetical protein